MESVIKWIFPQRESSSERFAKAQAAFRLMHPTQEDLEAQNAECHPVNKLPPELLELVLWELLPKSSPSSKIPYTQNEREHQGWNSLATITQICRHWRRIILDSPRMWTTLDIKLRGTSRVVSPSIDVIQLWLQRSKDSPLKIKFVASRSDASLSSDAFASVCQRVLAVVFAHTHRWQDVCLELDELDMARVLLPISPRAPLLRRLRLQFHMRTSPYLPRGLDTMLQRARLTTLHAEFGHYRIHWLDNPIRWSTLSILTLQTSQSATDCVKLLLNAPNLRECVLETVDYDEPCEPDVLTVNHALPHLHKLHIHGRGFITSILHPSFTMPSLSDLSLVFSLGMDMPEENRSGIPVVSFLQQSTHHETLTHLVLGAIYLEEDLLCSLIPSLTNLELLEILCVDDAPTSLANKVITALDPDTFAVPPSAVETEISSTPSPIGRPLPKLTTLRIFGNFDPQDGLLSTMISKRVGEEADKRGIASLHRIQIEFHGDAPRHTQDEQSLLELQRKSVLFQVVIR